MTLLSAASRAPKQTPGLSALYIVPHQDDEHLTLGAAMLADKAAGRDVYALLTNRGEASAVRTGATATFLGYTPNFETFAAARDREFIRSCELLGVTPIVPPFADRQPDGGSTTAGITALVQAASPVTGPNVLLRATSDHDSHIDHRNCGLALIELYASGFGTDPRLFIPNYRTDLFPSPMTKMGNHGDLTLAHQWPYRHQDAGAGWWGIGYTSVSPSFNYVLDTDGASYWHRPLGGGSP